jgi:hypothetical protein
LNDVEFEYVVAVGPLTTIEKSSVWVKLVKSPEAVSCTVKLDVVFEPTALAVPVILPFDESSDKPPGSEPDDTVKLPTEPDVIVAPQSPDVKLSELLA